MNERIDYERTPNPLMDAWDALPRGPAIFIATCDEGRPVHGTWVNVNQPEQYFFGELDLLLREPDQQQRQREWIVLDQVGVGDVMFPEHLSLAGLHHLLANRRENS
jgi:hypothetical protein